ncbi:hypothetical protein AOQ84DRAFT_227902 [Glonium stellatum]|uniref:Uncharacterized protein n=1 Tax=Glonium stellatum TaxID=574774 RepID=A0A8E2JX17_9PEZI|nr:hypothetical protein AOQ84DRAFT_227902 [Glonium stellatum]
MEGITLGPIRPQAPACIPPTDLCGNCTVYGARARLFYWPVTTVSGDVCSHPGATLTSNITGIVTADVFGQKLTSPTAALLISSVWASDYCNYFFGKTFTSLVMTMHPSALSSGVGWHGMEPRSFDLADLYPGQVRFKAYTEMGECTYFPAWCTNTIYQEWYHPNVLMPQDVTNLDPAWATCTPYIFGILDPPVAVKGVPAFISTTPTAGPQTQSMDPSPGVTAVPIRSTAVDGQPQSTPATGDPQSAPPIGQPSPVAGGSTMPGVGASTIADPGHSEKMPSMNGGEGVPSSTPTKPLGGFILSGLGGPGGPETTNGMLQSPQSGAVVMLGNQVITAVDPAGVVVIGSITISPGGPAATISGHVISAVSTGVVIDGTSKAFSNIGTLTENLGVVITLDGQVLTALDPSGVITIGSTLISLGGPAATISGHTISALSSGVVVDGTTIPLSIITDPPGAPTTSGPMITSATSDTTSPQVFEGSAGYANGMPVIAPVLGIFLAIVLAM